MHVYVPLICRVNAHCSGIDRDRGNTQTTIIGWRLVQHVTGTGSSVARNRN